MQASLEFLGEIRCIISVCPIISLTLNELYKLKYTDPKKRRSDQNTLFLESADEPIEPDLKIININFIAVTYTAKLALHYFAKSNSSDRCLILKSSMAGYLDGIGNPSYQCSKFAVRGLMCNLRRSDLCRVNLISPL